MDNARGTGPVVEKTYQFVAWLIPTLEKFPRSQKILLGDRIQATALDVLEQLIEATYKADIWVGGGNFGRPIQATWQRLPK